MKERNMPRIARKDFETSFFHIMIQGIRKENIFNDIEDNIKILKIIGKYNLEFNIKIYSYCIMSNHAHILVECKNIKDMSEFMRKINTIYAMYYNKKNDRKGYVFRNRFKSEPIYNFGHLIRCINYIHNNPVKANMCQKPEEYPYSSVRDRLKIVNRDIKEIYYIEVDIKNEFIDYIEEKELKTKEEILIEFNVSISEIKENEEMLRMVSKKLYEQTNLTQKEIANIFKVSVAKVNEILNRKRSVSKKGTSPKKERP